MAVDGTSLVLSSSQHEIRGLDLQEDAKEDAEPAREKAALGKAVPPFRAESSFQERCNITAYPVRNKTSVTVCSGNAK